MDSPTISDPTNLVNAETGEPTNTNNGAVKPGRLGRLRSLATRISRRHAILASAVLLVLGIACSSFLFVGEVEPEVPVEPTASEKFRVFLAGLVEDETAARLDDFQIDDAMLRELTKIDRLTTIQVDLPAVTTDTLTAVAAMPNLQQLHLRGLVVDDEMIGILAKSKTIWLLNLPKTTLSLPAIESLSSMPELRQLRLGVQSGSNQHGRAVATLTRLRSVHLIGVAITDEGLQPLAEMPQLESLYLDDTAVTDAGWNWLFANHPQLHIHVNQKHHDRDPQKH